MVNVPEMLAINNYLTAKDRQVSFIRIQTTKTFDDQIIPIIDSEAKKYSITRNDVIRKILERQFRYTSKTIEYPDGKVLKHHCDIPIEFGLKYEIIKMWTESSQYHETGKRTTMFRLLSRIICDHFGLGELA